MGKLYIRSICLRVQGKDHLTHLLLVLVERPLHRLRRIAEILTVTNHQLMKNGILHGARVALLNAPLINCRYTLDVLSSDSWDYFFMQQKFVLFFCFFFFCLFFVFRFSLFFVHFSRFCFRITEVQYNRLSNWRSWFHLHSCFISSNRLDLFYENELYKLHFNFNLNLKFKWKFQWAIFKNTRSTPDSTRKCNHHGNFRWNYTLLELSSSWKYSHCVLYSGLLLRWSMEATE
jgi:hypothetical protein